MSLPPHSPVVNWARTQHTVTAHGHSPRKKIPGFGEASGTLIVIYVSITCLCCAVQGAFSFFMDLCAPHDHSSTLLLPPRFSLVVLLAITIATSPPPTVPVVDWEGVNGTSLAEVAVESPGKVSKILGLVQMYLYAKRHGHGYRVVVIEGPSSSSYAHTHARRRHYHTLRSFPWIALTGVPLCISPTIPEGRVLTLGHHATPLLVSRVNIARAAGRVQKIPWRWDLVGRAGILRGHGSHCCSYCTLGGSVLILCSIDRSPVRRAPRTTAGCCILTPTWWSPRQGSMLAISSRR